VRQAPPAAFNVTLRAALAARAVPSIAEVQAKVSARVRGGLAPRAMRKVRDHIEAHLDGKISIVALAAVAGLSPFHFARAFKQSAGATPHDYLIQRRVERVRVLLVGTNLPLSEIALAVGFSDQSHCARRFREHVGMCPSDYRWSMR